MTKCNEAHRNRASGTSRRAPTDPRTFRPAFRPPRVPVTCYVDPVDVTTSCTSRSVL